MRRMESARFNCATGGWSATQAIPPLRLQVRRYGHDRTRFAISAVGDVALLVDGQRPWADSNSHPVGPHSATRSPGASLDPDSTTVGDSPFDEPVRQVYGKHSSGAATCQLAAARSAHSRRQALYLAEGC